MALENEHSEAYSICGTRFLVFGTRVTLRSLWQCNQRAKLGKDRPRWGGAWQLALARIDFRRLPLPFVSYKYIPVLNAAAADAKAPIDNFVR